MANPFRSERLIYRAIESPEDDALFQAMRQDPIAYQNSSAGLLRPQSKKQAVDHLHAVAQGLLAVAICLPSSDPQASPTAIGEINIHNDFEKHPHHRCGTIGIALLEAFQGKGYGSEAVRWSLDWAFNVAGLHKVHIEAFEWNTGARRLYERIGFKHEGTRREVFFHQGRFWDGYLFGMLDREWAEMKSKAGNEKGQKEVTSQTPAA